MCLRRTSALLLALAALGTWMCVSDAESHAQAVTTLNRVTPRLGTYVAPAISGDTVVWFDGRRSKVQGRIPGIDIYGRNLRTGRTFRITSSPTADVAGSLMVSQQTVLWVDCRHCHRVNGLPGYAGDQIFVHNIASGREFSLPLRMYGQIGPWLLQGLAVWGKSARHGQVKFYAADSISGHPHPLATDRAFRTTLAKRDHLVVWRDSYDLRVSDLLTGRTMGR